MMRSRREAMWRGFRCKCPKCGEGALFYNYLKVHERCSFCGEELHHQRADDAPPYFTMTVVAHIVVPGLLITEKLWQPEIWKQLAFWLTATIFLTWWLMPRVKGAIIGLQWALRMHGFGGIQDKPASP